MRCSYEDIFRKAGAPLWFDEFGVPRYRVFGPKAVANVYAREVALARIACRNCNTSFIVAFSRPGLSPVPSLSIAELIMRNRLNFGDAPNTQCCPKVSYIGTITRQIIEYWARQSTHNDWQRDPRLERVFDEVAPTV